MRTLINKIPNKKIRILFKEFIFSRTINKELADKVSQDVINLEIQKYVADKKDKSTIDYEKRIALKKAIRDNLYRKTYPSYFLINFVYPFFVSVLVSIIVLKFLNQ